MTRIFRYESFWYALIIIVYYCFSYTPLVWNVFHTPQDRVYLGQNDYPLDFLGNLATVRQGYEGSLFRVSKVTSTMDSVATLMKMEYVLIGHAARIMRMDPIIFMMMFRFVLSLGIMVVLIKIVRMMWSIPSYRIITFFAVIFSTGIIIPGQANIMFQMPGDALVFSRLSLASVHYLMGYLFGLLVMISLSKFFQSLSVRHLGYAVGSGIITSFVYAPTMLLILVSLPIYLIIRIAVQKEKKNRIQTFTMILMILSWIGIVSLPFLYSRYASQFWDMNMMIKTEKIVPFSITIANYPFILGLSGLIALGSIPIILKRKKPMEIFLVSLFISHGISIFLISNLIGMNRLRFFLTPYFIIVSLIASVGIIYMMEWVKNHRSKRYIVIFLFAVGSIFFPSFYSYDHSIRSLAVCFCSYPDFGYPKKTEYETYHWLSKYTRDDEIVLSSDVSGTFIPALSGNGVYTSWWHLIMNPDNRSEVSSYVNQFYSGSMSDEEAMSFLKTNRIHYIYFGEEEQKIRKKDNLPYSFLKIRYSNKSVKLFEV